MARKKPKKGPPKRKFQRPAETPRGPSTRQFHQATHSHFSLAEEARYTSGHRSRAFESGAKLRHLPIHFVSAGLLEGTLNELEPELEPPLVTPEATRDPQSPTVTAAIADMTLRSPSPIPSSSDSSSSEDEIVFHGRPAAQSAKQATATTVASDSSDPHVDDPVSPKQHRSPIESLCTEEPAVTREPTLAHTDTDTDTTSVVQDMFEQRLGGQSKWMTNTTPWVSRSKPGIGWLPVQEPPDMAAFLAGHADPTDAGMDDYMQNIHDFSTHDEATIPTTFANRPMDIGTTSSDRGQWDEDDDDDDDDDEEDEDQDDDDDDDGDNDDIDVSLFLGEEETSEESMDDERIARILQKQEELGLASDDIVLFGPDDLFDDSNDTVRHDRPSTKRKSRYGRVQPNFPSASAFADALDQDPYNGFDIMDTNRPLLRPTKNKKGRRGQLPPEISDDELNEQMQAAWENDRAKKRVKKAEREELRKQGLLGRKGKAPNLSVKYKDGMNHEETVEEIREFLFSDMQTMALPPMEANRRAVVHRFVHQLGLTSKSRGDGFERFTVLSKTLRTKNIDDDEFDDIVGRKQFRSRLQVSVTRGYPRKGTKNRPVVSYKDGETVGASAPELGPENKGRVLLEKMGWTKGTALGAMDNKGILQPIAHTVKMTKAGLQ